MEKINSVTQQDVKSAYGKRKYCSDRCANRIQTQRKGQKQKVLSGNKEDLIIPSKKNVKS